MERGKEARSKDQFSQEKPKVGGRRTAPTPTQRGLQPQSFPPSASGSTRRDAGRQIVPTDTSVWDAMASTRNEDALARGQGSRRTHRPFGDQLAPMLVAAEQTAIPIHTPSSPLIHVKNVIPVNTQNEYVSRD